jgi:hypothetical protein
MSLPTRVFRLRAFYILFAGALAFILALGLGFVVWTLRHEGADSSAATVRDQLAELQTECADQAALVLSREGQEARSASSLNSHTAHYSARLDECFLVTRTHVFAPSSVDNRAYDIRILADPFENRDFAKFRSATDVGSKVVRLQECVLLPRVGKPSVCHSVDEWERLVEQFIK